jgi:hypothetical protein
MNMVSVSKSVRKVIIFCFLKDVPDDGGPTDREVSGLALSRLQSHEWAFSFVYMQNTDKTGPSLRLDVGSLSQGDQQIDFDLSETTRARQCPFAGALCITPPTSVSLGEAPLIFPRLTRCA